MSHEAGGSSHRIQPIEDTPELRIDEGKVQAKFYIDADVYREFKAWVRERHGGSEAKGLLSFEAEQALVEYAQIRRKSQPHTHAKAERQIPTPRGPPYKVTVVKQKVLDFLREKYGIQVYRNVLISHLYEALASLYVDRRTQVEWMKRFARYGMMRKIDDLHVEFI